ncbi:MAG: hypothetical protein V1936_03895 [Patescibacteria group bacterium]
MNFKKILAAATLTFLLAGCGGLSEIEAKNLAVKFINENLLSGGMTAEITNIAEESGLWKLDVKLSDGREVKSLLSKDGKIFVPEAIYIDEVEKAAAEQKAAETKTKTEALAAIPKTAKPVVELFVMSYCPFGTQAEKAIIPALEKLGDSVDFRLKFVDYALHGEKEIKENLLQFALSEKYPEKLIPYLQEFLKAGNSEAALKAIGLTADDLKGTIDAADAKFEITKNFTDQTLWLKGQDGQPTYPHFNPDKEENAKYGVRGSPTLVVNGKVIDSVDRSPAGMLKAICSGFETAAANCSAELSTETASSGFGLDAANETGSNGQCS